MKYSVITFGCRVNQADSLAVEAQLLEIGAEPGPPDLADIVVVNTCSVTASADQGARQTIRRIARTNPAATIVVTGCYATREPEQVAMLPNVARVVPNSEKARLLTLAGVGAAFDSVGPRTLTTAERFGGGEGSCGATLEPGVAGRTAFTLRVQTGCSEPCSYCIIPSTRGAPSSVPVARVLDDVRRAAAAGFKEVTLTGVHLGSYGRDLDEPTTLVELLEAIRGLRGAAGGSCAQEHVLFRISSLEPMDCSPEIVALVRDSACFAPHFHLPLQHASTRMLTAMRRPYDLRYFARLVDSIRQGIPHASIGTDIIVGFPGETDDDFEQLARYLEDSPLTHLHVFPYSDRPGTAASRMGERPHGTVVKARGARLRDIGSHLTRRFLLSQAGAVRRALTVDDGTVAVTDNYLKVRIPPGLTRNQWVEVRVTGIAPAVTGEVIPSV